MSVQPAQGVTPATPEYPKDSKLYKSCQQFEGQFFDLMLQEMRKTVPPDPELGDDANQQDIFQGMMDDNTAQQMALHGGANDLASQMYKQLSHEMKAKGSATTGIPAPTALSPAAALKTYSKSTENEKR